MKLCQTLYDNSLDKFEAWDAFYENIAPDELPEELNQKVKTHLLWNNEKCILDDKKCCMVCETYICNTHMHVWVCISCDVKILCRKCHEKFHTGHAKWSDIPYEI